MGILKRLVLSSGLLAMVALGTSCTQPQPERLALKSGDVRDGSIEVTSNISLSSSLIPAPLHFSGTEKLRLKMTVKDVPADGGPITIESTIDSMDLDIGMELGGQDLSDMIPVKTVFGDGLEAIRGKSFTIQVTPRGEVLAVDGVEAIQASFREAVDVPLGGDDPNQGILSPGQMHLYVSNLFCVFPEEPIVPEMTWQSESVLKGGIDATIIRAWSQQSALESFVTYSANTELKTSPDSDAGGFLGGLPGTGSIQGRGETTREVDRATGWVVEGTESMLLEGSLTLDGMPMMRNTEIQLDGKTVIATKTY